MTGSPSTALSTKNLSAKLWAAPWVALLIRLMLIRASSKAAARALLARVIWPLCSPLRLKCLAPILRRDFMAEPPAVYPAVVAAMSRKVRCLFRLSRLRVRCPKRQAFSIRSSKPPKLARLDLTFIKSTKSIKRESGSVKLKPQLQLHQPLAREWLPAVRPCLMVAVKVRS